MMMKKLLVCFALLIGATSSFAADSYTGSSVSDAATLAGETADDKTFVLYNVGTGKFMVNGGIWGTQAVLSDKLVTTFNVVSTTTLDVYYLYTNIQTKESSSSTDRYMNLSNGTNMANSGYFFLDQGNNITKEYTDYSAYAKYTFTEVSGQTNVYTIKNQGNSEYLTAETEDAYGTVIKTSSTATNNNAQWMLVSIANLKEHFKVAEGTEAVPATASFMVQDPGFNRGDQTISKWYRGKNTTNSALINNKLLTSDTDQTGTDVTHYVKPASAIKTTKTHTVRTYTVTCNYYYWRRQNSSHSFTYQTTDEELTEGQRTSNFITGDDCSNNTYHNHATQSNRQGITSQTVTLTETKETTETTNAGYQYYVGNGYNEAGKNMTCVEDDATQHGYLQQDYGGYWTANIHGQSGTIFQQLQITREGIYKVSCKGFTTDGTGYLFANVGNAQGTAAAETYVTTKLQTVASAPETYVKASKELDGQENYTSVIIKVSGVSEQNPVTLTFGAFTTDGSESSWTCVDNFTLDYCGPIVNDLLLDEDEESIDYINAQVVADKAQTLYLHRTFKAGKWNSLVLPVSMTAEQVATAFGAETKLSALSSTENEGKQIIFEPATEIEAGKLYIIKPSNAINQNSKTVKISVNGMETDFTVNSYYQCAQIKLTTALESASVEGDLVSSTEDNGIRHKGTYVKTGSSESPAIDKDTYILSGGKWYYNTVAVNTVKGFRGWIATGQSKTDAQATKFVINGVEEDAETTGIEGITADQPAVLTQPLSGIYTLAGQKVRDGLSTDGLTKGIYIVGGKKMVVK